MTLTIKHPSQDKLNLLNKQVDYYTKAVQQAEEVKDFLKSLFDKWNGKTYNKRFTTAFQKQFPNPNIRIYKDNIRLSIEFRDWQNRSIKSVEGSHTNYITDDTICLCSLYTDLHGDLIIDAESAKDCLETYILNLKNRIEKVKDYISRINEVVDAYNEAKTKLEDIVGDTPYVVRDIVGIKY